MELFGWQTVKQVQEANCLRSDWLKVGSDGFALRWFIHFSCGSSLQHQCVLKLSRNHLWFLCFWCCLFMSFSTVSLKHRYHFLAASLQDPATCLTAVRVFVCMFYACSSPISHQLVCRALVCQTCACAYVCLCSSAVLFHSHLQKVTPTR